MFLFQDVDPEQTEQNVLKFFSDDYRRLCSMAGANLQSPVLSATPAAKSVQNPQEDKFIKLIENRKILDAVNRSIKACSHDSQVILNQRIIKNNELHLVMTQLNVSSYSTYYKMQTVACNAFADAFEVQAEPYFSNNENDLHAYKKPKV